MLRRVIYLPMYMVLMAVRLIVNLLLRMSAWIFYMIAFLFLLTAVLCYYMDLDSAVGIRQTVIGGGLFFIIPQAASILAGLLDGVAEVIRDRI